MLKEIQAHARQLKAETYALYLAYRDPRVPWYARVLGLLVVAYAFSPIDLIPDFVPVLGYLDDLVLIPLGMALVLRLIPAEVMADCRAHAADVMAQGEPVNRWAGAIIVLIWIGGLALAVLLVARLLRR
ncbi:MAG: DUF1232 domain-containing protein [Anaerolineae bacterium]|nr:DUF1232 domain-containing protein [Anaerolineae bacterium]